MRTLDRVPAPESIHSYLLLTVLFPLLKGVFPKRRAPASFGADHFHELGVQETKQEMTKVVSLQKLGDKSTIPVSYTTVNPF